MDNKNLKLTSKSSAPYFKGKERSTFVRSTLGKGNKSNTSLQPQALPAVVLSANLNHQICVVNDFDLPPSGVPEKFLANVSLQTVENKIDELMVLVILFSALSLVQGRKGSNQ